ncbi:IclR family transcriptional regulator domain-containing protein [Ornithinimicrobium tianjinense]
MPPARRPRGGVQSIDRAVQILRCFDSEDPALGITELSRRTGLSTSTVHRILASMLDNDLVQQGSDRRYRLGPLILQLGRNGGIPAAFRDAALPVAKRLRDLTDETVGIHELLPNEHRAVIEQVESRQELRRTYTEFGVPIPIHHGAPGKALLSHLPADRQEWWLAQPIDPATPRTIDDPRALRRQLREIRALGWAYSDGERTSGIRAVAAPVTDHAGEVVGALGLSVPTLRLDDERREVLGEAVRDAAWQVSLALGATPESRARVVQRAGG